jgi:hypothetical protein
MSTKFLAVEDAAKRAGKDEFFQSVKRAVIPRLIGKGILQGKKVKKCEFVADDEALARVLQPGVEAFVYNQQGYSFMAVRAPIEQVAAKLELRPGVSKYEEKVKPLKMKRDVSLQGPSTLRHTFLIQMSSAPNWSVLIQTVHWFHSCDAVMATALACALSKDLKTLAASAWDDDFSGSSVIICENGKQKASVSDEEEGWEGFYEFFYENGVSVPQSFIGTEKGKASLYVADPAELQRADRVVLKVPAPIESKGPRVMEKFGMMVQALAEGLDGEEAFMEQMRGGIWEQAQRLLTSGQF